MFNFETILIFILVFNLKIYNKRKNWRNKMKRRDYFFIYMICSVILAPLVFLELFTKSYGLSQFVTASIFISLVLVPFGIIVDMIWPRDGFKRSFFKEKAFELKELKLTSKETNDNSIRVPAFMCAISPVMIPLYLLNKEETLYYLNFKNGTKEFSIRVSKDEFLKYEKNDLVKVKISSGEGGINLCWFEMMVLGHFQDTFFGQENRYSLAKI